VHKERAVVRGLKLPSRLEFQTQAFRSLPLPMVGLQHPGFRLHLTERKVLSGIRSEHADWQSDSDVMSSMPSSSQEPGPDDKAYCGSCVAEVFSACFDAREWTWKVLCMNAVGLWAHCSSPSAAQCGTSSGPPRLAARTPGTAPQALPASAVRSTQQM
jgi:hypothetical protein